MKNIFLAQHSFVIKIHSAAFNELSKHKIQGFKIAAKVRREILCSRDTVIVHSIIKPNDFTLSTCSAVFLFIMNTTKRRAKATVVFLL